MISSQQISEEDDFFRGRDSRSRIGRAVARPHAPITIPQREPFWTVRRTFLQHNRASSYLSLIYSGFKVIHVSGALSEGLDKEITVHAIVFTW